MTPVTNLDRPLLLEPLSIPLRNDDSLDIDMSILKTTAEGTTEIVVTGQVCCMGSGSLIGNASVVNIIDDSVPPVHETSPSAQPSVGRVQSQPGAWRKERLADLVGRPELLTVERPRSYTVS